VTSQSLWKEKGGGGEGESIKFDQRKRGGMSFRSSSARGGNGDGRGVLASDTSVLGRRGEEGLLCFNSGGFRGVGAYESQLLRGKEKEKASLLREGYKVDFPVGRSWGGDNSHGSDLRS